VTEPPPADSDRDPLEINTTVPNPSRLHNYLTGGQDNFAVDRELARDFREAAPDADVPKASALAVESFAARAVRYLVGEGVRQFLTTTFIPISDPIHELAQELAPTTRVVYIGSDPVALAHAHSFRKSTSEGATAFIHDSVRRNPRRLLRQAAATLDFSQPVALMLLETLSFIRDEDDPWGIVTQFVERLSSGSYLVVAHSTNDIQTDRMNEMAKRLTEDLDWTWVPRDRAEITRFFDGLELTEGGIVHIDQWRRHEHQPIPFAEELIPLYGAVARKP